MCCVMLCDLAADLGGIIGLFLGGSAISMFEVLDVIVVSMVIHLQFRLHKADQVSPTSSGTGGGGIAASKPGARPQFEHIQLENELSSEFDSINSSSSSQRPHSATMKAWPVTSVA
jgi:hypothetical protein